MRPESSNTKLEEACPGTEEERWETFRVLARMGAEPVMWACNEFGLRLFVLELKGGRWEGQVPYTCTVHWIETETGAEIRDMDFLPKTLTATDTLNVSFTGVPRQTDGF